MTLLLGQSPGVVGVCFLFPPMLGEVPAPRAPACRRHHSQTALRSAGFLLHVSTKPWAIAQSPPLTAQEVTNYACETRERISRTDGIGVAFSRMDCNLLHGDGQRKNFQLIGKTSAKAGFQIRFFFLSFQRHVYNGVSGMFSSYDVPKKNLYAKSFHFLVCWCQNKVPRLYCFRIIIRMP